MDGKKRRLILLLAIISSSFQFQLSYADYDTFTVNIPNAQGGYTTLGIKKSGNGYVGPKGEYYSNFPSVSQLQAVYGTDASLPTLVVPTQSNGVQPEQPQALQQIQQQEQPQQNSFEAVSKKIKGWIYTIFILSIIGICAYTCFHAYKGRMLFFYNWFDVIGAFAFTILSIIGLWTSKKYMVFIGIAGIIGYNSFMSYKYYYPKKQHLNMVFVGLSRIIMSIFLPIAYVLVLFSGAKRDDYWYNQLRDEAVQAAWFVLLSTFLYRIVNGHLMVELEEGISENNHQTESPETASIHKTPYEILGVRATDSIENIKAAYRDLMMKYHPDRTGGLGPEIVAFATAKTQEINAAYDFVLNEKGMNRG